MVRDDIVVTIKKGCASDNERTSCTRERCVCETTLCNADLEVAGGDMGMVYGYNKAGGMTRLSGAAKMCSLIGIVFVILSCVNYSDQLNCCVGSTTLREFDGDVRCIEKTTSCDNSGCQETTCEEADDCSTNVTCGVPPLPPESPTDSTSKPNPNPNPNNFTTTTTTTRTTTTMKPPDNYMCRIIYYQLHTGSLDDVHGFTLDEVNMVEKQCVWQDPSEGRDSKELSCEFYQKTFYLDQNIRLTTRKDCYCKGNYCNKNLSEACKSNQNMNNTCPRSQATTPNHDQNAIFLSFLSVFLVQILLFL